MRPIVVMSCGVSDDGHGFQGRMSYVHAIERAGGSVMVVPPQQQLQALAYIASQSAGILLPGGGDVDPLQYGEEAIPENGRVEPVIDAIDLFLAHHALAQGKPILAICRGCQVLNVAAGGTLIQDLLTQGSVKVQHFQKAPRWHASHYITLAKGSRLAGILGVEKLLVNSFHHQAVQLLGQGMVAVAHATDGVVEAIEMPEHPFALGVQWHPEVMVEHHPQQGRIFDAFIAASAASGKNGK